MSLSPIILELGRENCWSQLPSYTNLSRELWIRETLHIKYYKEQSKSSATNLRSFHACSHTCTYACVHVWVSTNTHTRTNHTQVNLQNTNKLQKRERSNHAVSTKHFPRWGARQKTHPFNETWFINCVKKIAHRAFSSSMAERTLKISYSKPFTTVYW